MQFSMTPVQKLVMNFIERKSIKTAFDLPPKDALKYLQKKAGNLIQTDAWDSLNSSAHDKAFTVAKVMSADILQVIYNKVVKAKAEGLTLKQFQDELLPELHQAGWGGTTAGRLRVIYDTNMQVAYSKEKYKGMMLVADKYPYWQYKQIERNNKRDQHSKWHNKIFRYDDPIWQSIYPPSAFGCKCSVVTLTEQEVKAKGLTVSKGTDFKVDKPDIECLKAFNPDTSKYINKLATQLTTMIATSLIREQKRNTELRKQFDMISYLDELLPKTTDKDMRQSWGADYTVASELFHNIKLTKKDLVKIYLSKQLINGNENVNLSKHYNGFELVISNTSVRVERFFIPDSVVRHYHYEIFDADKMGKGSSKEIFLNQLALYKKLGYKRITVQANIDVGCYTWAKFGFKFDGELRRYDFVSILQARYTDTKEQVFKRCLDYVKTKPDFEVIDLIENCNSRPHEVKNALLQNKCYWYGYYDLEDLDAIFDTYEYCNE